MDHREAPGATAAALAVGRDRPWAARFRRYGAAYLMLLPAFAVIGGLVFYPLVLSIWDSLHVDNLLVPSHAWAGASNYTGVLTDQAFLSAALNTVWYLGLTTVLSLVVGTAMAMFLHNIKHLRAVMLAVIVLPWAVPGTVSGDLWSLIFNPQTGLLDGLLVGLHIVSHPVLWMAGSVTARVAISVSLVWQVAPITAVIVLAGLESIPPTLFEQAAVDGATGSRRFTRITLPLLRPALAIGLLEATVLGIGAFDQIVVLNGYSSGTLSVVEQVYLYAFQDFNFGYGIAASMVVTVATLVVSVVYLKGLYREVSY